MIDQPGSAGDDLPPELHDAVELLREEREPGAEWRARVLRSVALDSHMPHPVRGRIWMAAAAGLVGLLIGGSAVYVAMRTGPVAVTAHAPSPPNDEHAVQIRFTYQAPGASTVAIVGDFNRWDPAAIPLRRSADGKTWEIEIPLAPGRYAYAFYVDGALARDPAAPQVRDDDFGTPNSVVMVRGS
jgi:hypothetical protein